MGISPSKWFHLEALGRETQLQFLEIGTRSPPAVNHIPWFVTLRGRAR